MAFLRHLPALGYRCQVLTTSAFGGDDEVLRAWEPLSLYRWLFSIAGCLTAKRGGGALILPCALAAVI